MKYVSILLALFLAGNVQAADTDFKRVVNCMRSSIPPVLQVESFQIESTDKAGATRALEGKIYAQRDQNRLRFMMYVASPSTVSGTAYLVREKKSSSEDDMYVFLPSVNRVRHITGEFANGSLLGTDFSYAEIKQISNAFSGADGQYVGKDSIEGHDVDVISLKPLPVQKSPYSSVKAWVDQKSCFVLKAELYVGKTVRKRMIVPVDSIKQSGKFWYLSHVEMEDLKRGTHTVLRLGGVDSEKEIPSSNFNPAVFYLGH